MLAAKLGVSKNMTANDFRDIAVAKKRADGHKSGLMVRLPESFREPLKKLKEKTRRNMTVEVQIALESHFKKNGIESTTIELG